MIYQIKIKESKSIEVNIVSKEGTLSIEVYDKNTSYYEGNIDKGFDFTINLEKGNFNVMRSASFCLLILSFSPRRKTYIKP